MTAAQSGPFFPEPPPKTGKINADQAFEDARHFLLIEDKYL